ncbi:hypothetical protein HGB25_02660 [Candidatus Saccharibacteria bacterium]|nr:hypothetical protein [Candidatus Saccharibacteria bacterium]
MIQQQGPLILESFEKNGEWFPPLYQECSNCIYSLGRLSISFCGIEVEYVCPKLHRYVAEDDWCPGHILDIMKISDETEEALEQAELSGTLPNDWELSDEELEQFRAESD